VSAVRTGLRRALGAAPAKLLGWAVALRNRRYARPGGAWRAGVPVLSVGNLAVGGTGKTPMVLWLCSALLDDGRRPAVITRGYGGSAGRGPLWVSRGAGPLVDARDGGDEPVMLARALAGVRIVAGSDRRAGALAAIAAGSDVVVLDDGFQHRRVARDLDIVLVDGRDPFAGGRLLPAGDLREPPGALARADIVVLSGLRHDDPAEAARVAIARVAPRAAVMSAGRELRGFADAAGAAQPAPRRAVAFCAIAHPERFRSDLASLGIEIVAFRAFRDHHRFRPAELHELQRAAASCDAALVTTEKDLARMDDRNAGVPLQGLLTLVMRAAVHDADALLGRVRRALAESGR